MRIIWTETANYTFKKEQDFIFKKWNVIEVLKFIDLVDEILINLKTFPEIGAKFINYRSLVISKQTTLIYRIINEDSIEVLLFWNNKWSPEDFEKYIKK